MDAVDPVGRSLRLIDRTIGGQRTAAVGAEKMLRIYFVQQWFSLTRRDSLYDSESIRRFVRIELSGRGA
jgi:hypothetical protein